MSHLQIFSFNHRQPFGFVDIFPCCTKYFQLYTVQFVDFCFCFTCLRRLIKKKKKYYQDTCQRTYRIHFLLEILWFQILKFLLHFELIFVYGMRKQSVLILLHVALQFTKHYLQKMLYFPHCIFLPPSLSLNFVQKCGFISGLYILFLSSIYLFLCQYQNYLIPTTL